MIMPDFVNARASYNHTISSALLTLLRLGHPLDRVNLTFSSNGDGFGRIIEQNPNAGEAVDESGQVTFRVGGFGYFYQIPYALRAGAPHDGLGLREILRPLDSSYIKAYFLTQQAFRLFDIRKDNLEACARWIELFGLDSTEWPEDRWFALALLLPQVYRLAGTEGGVRLALKTIMNLDVIRFSAKPDFVFQRSRKATALSQEPHVVQWGFDTLGLTTTLGPKIEVTRTLVVEVGPLEFSTWEALQDPTEITLLRNTLDLIMPIERGYRVRAVVGDPADCPTFGDDRDDAPSMNCSLGIDTHIGRPDRPSVDSVAFPL